MNLHSCVFSSLKRTSNNIGGVTGNVDAYYLKVIYVHKFYNHDCLYIIMIISHIYTYHMYIYIHMYVCVTKNGLKKRFQKPYVSVVSQN